MYRCIYVCMCIYIYIYMCVCVFVCIWVYIMFVHVSTRMCLSISHLGLCIGQRLKPLPHLPAKDAQVSYLQAECAAVSSGCGRLGLLVGPDIVTATAFQIVVLKLLPEASINLPGTPARGGDRLSSCSCALTDLHDRVYGVLSSEVLKLPANLRGRRNCTTCCRGYRSASTRADVT